MAEQNRSGESRNGAERPCYYQTSLTELTKKDKRKKQKKISVPRMRTKQKELGRPAEEKWCGGED
jgi:hypothetical protein